MYAYVLVSIEVFQIMGKNNFKSIYETHFISKDQYRVVYKALLEAFRGKGKAIPTRRFLQEFQDHSCYVNLGEVANKSPLPAEFQVIPQPISVW
jgi:hypothetical protein